MKKLLLVILLISVSIFLVACGSDEVVELEEIEEVEEDLDEKNEEAENKDEDSEESEEEVEEDLEEESANKNDEYFKVRAKLMGRIDSNSVEMKIIESNEYDFPESYSYIAFRYSPEVYEDFNSDVYETGDFLTFLVEKIEGEDYVQYFIKEVLK